MVKKRWRQTIALLTSLTIYVTESTAALARDDPLLNAFVKLVCNWSLELLWQVFLIPLQRGNGSFLRLKKLACTYWRRAVLVSAYAMQSSTYSQLVLFLSQHGALANSVKTKGIYWQLDLFFTHYTYINSIKIWRVWPLKIKWLNLQTCWVPLCDA